MERKRDGFVTIGDVAGAVQLSSGRGLTPVAPDAPRHFTKLDQVDQFVRASEAEPMSGSWRGCSRYAGCGVPISATGASTGGSNGPFRLYMQAGPETKLPYGNLPRPGSGYPIRWPSTGEWRTEKTPHAHLMFSERGNDGIERSGEQWFKRHNAKAPEKGGARKSRAAKAGD